MEWNLECSVTFRTLFVLPQSSRRADLHAVVHAPECCPCCSWTQFPNRKVDVLHSCLLFYQLPSHPLAYQAASHLESKSLICRLQEQAQDFRQSHFSSGQTRFLLNSFCLSWKEARKTTSCWTNTYWILQGPPPFFLVGFWSFQTSRFDSVGLSPNFVRCDSHIPQHDQKKSHLLVYCVR